MFRFHARLTSCPQMGLTLEAQSPRSNFSQRTKLMFVSTTIRMQFSLRLLLLRRTDRLTNYLVSSITCTAWRPVAPDGTVGGRPAGQRHNDINNFTSVTPTNIRNWKISGRYIQNCWHCVVYIHCNLAVETISVSQLFNTLHKPSMLAVYFLLSIHAYNVFRRPYKSNLKHWWFHRLEIVWQYFSLVFPVRVLMQIQLPGALLSNRLRLSTQTGLIDRQR